MCTVTYIPLGNDLVITSNRDEKKVRKLSLNPDRYRIGSSVVLFPKDSDAGGTWFAVRENGNAGVLLNGAWISHRSSPPYRKSRGLILLDIISELYPVNAFSSIDLNNIEPFTLLIRERTNLFECRWDGTEKYHKQLDASAPHIWASVTLYDATAIHKRQQWFAEWLVKNPHPSPEEIVRFHRSAGDGDICNDLLMNRNNQLLTVSITSGIFLQNEVRMEYFDIQNGTSHHSRLSFQKPIAANP